MKLRDKAKAALNRRPKLALYAKSIVRRRSIIRGSRLVCYDKSRVAWEQFAELGAGAGEITVQVLLSALNLGTERARLLALPNANAEFPYVPSSSGVGRILRVGSGVSGLSVGDTVIGRFQSSTIQACSGKSVIKVENLPLEEAVLVRLANTSMQGLRMGRVQGGQRVAVMGQGIIGRLAALLAVAEGCEVLGITRTESKSGVLSTSDSVALEAVGAEERIREFAPDIVIDATGATAAIHQAIEFVRPGGRIVLLGSNRGTTSGLDVNGKLAGKRLTLIGAHRSNQTRMPPSWGGQFHDEAAKAIALIRAGKLSLATAISHRIDCVELATEYPRILKDDSSACAVIVDWTRHEEIQPDPNTIDHLEVPVKSHRPSPVRLALVGCGGIGGVNAAAVQATEGLVLAAAVDVNLELARGIGEQFGVAWGQSLEEVQQKSDVDAVFLATPHHLHEPIARDVLRQGKHVLIEKPLARTAEEARKILKEANQQGRLAKTFLPRRHRPQVKFARRLIELGAIGDVIGVELQFLQDKPVSYWTGGKRGRAASNWRYMRDKSGGGVLIMNLVHSLDAIFYLTECAVDTVFAHYGTLNQPEYVQVEDTIGLSFRTHCGAIGTISASIAAKGQSTDCLVIRGTCGQIVLDGRNLRFYSSRPIGQYARGKWHELEFQPNFVTMSRTSCLGEFALDVSAGKISGTDEPGYVVNALIDAAYESLHKNAACRVSGAERV